MGKAGNFTMVFLPLCIRARPPETFRETTGSNA